MSDSNVKIVFTAEQQQLLAAYNAQEQAETKRRDSIKRTSNLAREAHRAEQQMAKDSAKTYDATRTSVERYRAEVEKLKKQLSSGGIDNETFSRRRAQLNEQFIAEKKAAGAINEKAAADKKAAEGAFFRAEAEKKAADALARNNEIAKRNNQLNAESAALHNRNKTALERYTEGMAKADQLLARGSITKRDHRREAERLNEELENSKPAASQENLLGIMAKGIPLAAALRMGWQAVNTELTNYLDRAKAAANEQRGYAEASTEMRGNFKPDETIQSMDELDEAVLGIAKRTGLKPQNIANMATGALTARGDRTNQQVFDAVESAAMYARIDSEQGRELAMRNMHLLNVTGTTDAVAGMGFLSRVADSSAIPDPRQFGATAARAINDAVRRGESAESGAELVVGINRLMGDAEGSRSSTAATQLVEELTKFAPQPSEKDAATGKKFTVPQSDRDAYAAATTPSEKLKVLQGSPILQKAFFASGNATFETAARASIEGLVKADPRAMAIMQTVRDAVPALNADRVADFHASVKERYSGTFNERAIRMQRDEANAAIARVRDEQQEADEGEMQTALFGDDGLLTGKRANLGGMDELNTFSAKSSYWVRRNVFGQTPKEAAVNVLADEINTKGARATDSPLSLLAGGQWTTAGEVAANRMIGNGYTPERAAKENAPLIEKTNELLGEMLREMTKQPAAGRMGPLNGSVAPSHRVNGARDPVYVGASN